MLAAVPPGMDICVHLCGDSGWRTESVQFSAGACCNPFSEGCRGQITLQEGRRKSPSPFLLRNIAKVEHQFFSSGYLRGFRAFSVRKNENIGLLEGKHPRFCLESADVYAQEVRCFWPIVVLFFILFSLSVGVFCCKTVRISGCRTVIYVFDLLSMHYRKWKIEPFSALEGMLHAVRIFEGFRLVFHLFCIVFQP